MSRSGIALLLVLLAAGCAHAPAAEAPPPRSRLDVARAALHGGAFATADQILSEIAAEQPLSADGHEALFLLGLLHLDPRNPAWSPAEAEIVLGRYLEVPFGAQRPEAVSLFALARRLATPAGRARRSDGAAAAAAPSPPSSSPAAAEGGGGEAERLRRELAARDRELARLREELERIRRTLAPPKPR